MDWQLLPFVAEAPLEQVGGKALNLMRLTRAQFPVPSGFVIPIACYTAFVQHNALTPLITEALAELPPDNPAALEAASARIQAAFHRGEMPPNMFEAIEQAWRDLGAKPVAVRSSATAEDLPDLSFAGQQDTYLNITSPAALREAVINCWASLWTARAIGYRARAGIPPQEATLAVVVQQMVASDVSGVLFTANPLTECRTEMVIEATFGLGEALVSGQVEPDQYIVAHEGQSWRIKEKKQGAKAVVIRPDAAGGTKEETLDNANQQALPDAVILQLAQWGQHIQEHYGAPQDIEWAVLDPQGAAHIWILQSRPITSLYPLPENLPVTPFRALLGIHLIQGIHAPYTPLGRDVLVQLLLGVGYLFSQKVDLTTQTAIYDAGERLYLNISGILRHRLGRRFFTKFIGNMDPPTQRILQQSILPHPEFQPTGGLFAPRMLLRAVRFVGEMLFRMMRAWRNPHAARERFEHEVQRRLQPLEKAFQMAEQDPWQALQATVDAMPLLERFFPDVLLPHAFSMVLAGWLPFLGVLRPQAKKAAQALNQAELADLPMTISRGLPHNVTTEMDLALWEIAKQLRDDETATAWLQANTPEALATAWQAQDVPPQVRDLLTPFLKRYGARGVGEIDIGRPRWSEFPQHIFHTLQGYLRITDRQQAPDMVFEQGEAQALVAAAQLEEAVRQLPFGRLRARLVRWAVGRYRALGGTRESHKFALVRLVAQLRYALMAAGQHLHEQQALEQPEDIFYLRLNEITQAIAQKRITQEWRAAIQARRAIAEREERRQRLPRVLLSDGTAYYEAPPITDEALADNPNVLRGDPVSSGIVEGRARVVENPQEAHLQPGDILVCRGTDPAWTPLFLVAGGLVMEVGGMMTHGAVVAREYGIPAVVGIHNATERIQDGQWVQVDGSQGVVILKEETTPAVEMG